jgi:hypothetical protein
MKYLWSRPIDHRRYLNMCYFLTVAVPAKHVARIGEVFGRGFQAYPTANASVRAAIPEHFEAHLITSGMCSCDLYFGSRASAAPDHAARLRHKYERLGWNEAKIQRALAQSAAIAAKTSRLKSGFREDVIDRLGAMCGVASRIALLVHWYTGHVETEQISLEAPLRCRCDELAAQLRILGEDRVLIASAWREPTNKAC